MTVLPLNAADDPRAGGKARGLARLLKSGFRVPRGWAVFGDGPDASLLDAWRAAGRPAVAVRSSAAAEDGAAASFAGQFLTILGVRTDEAISEALRDVLDSQKKATAYGASAGAAAAVVMDMIEPECAGVAFGRDPATGEDVVVVESVKGRGDALVSGAETPKRARLRDSVEGESHLPDAALRELAAGVRKAGEAFGGPQDVEWAWAGGVLWYLQSRPVAPTAALLVSDLRATAGGRETAWSSYYNLAETVPAPTPMTFAWLRRMMSWDGGCGRAFRRLGFFFREDVRRDGFLTLVGGRLYADLERESASYFGEYPLAYDYAALARSPAEAANPEPKPDWRRATGRFWLRLPWYLWKLLAADRRIRRAMRTFPEEFDAWEATLPKDLRAPSAEELDVAAEMALTGSLLAGALWMRTPAAQRAALHTWLPSDLRHRGPGEMELANPRWRERPDDLARLKPAAARGEPDRVYALRERGKDALMRVTERHRVALLEAGRRSGLGADIFFCMPEELAAPDAARAAARRRERETLLRVPLPRLILARGDADEAAASNAGLSPGRATGIAWHPASPAEDPPPDAVLVVPSLDPAWTLLFPRVRAVVTERGGLLSHGAIVARELGVPCVCAPDARERFPEGTRLDVVGDRGEISAVQSAPSPSGAEPSTR